MRFLNSMTPFMDTWLGLVGVNITKFDVDEVKKVIDDSEDSDEL